MSTGRGSPVRQPAMRCETRRFIRLKALDYPSSPALQPAATTVPTTSGAWKLARSSSLLDDGPGLNLDPGTERERGRREGGPCWERRAEELSVGTIESRPVCDVSQVHIDFDDLLPCN